MMSQLFLLALACGSTNNDGDPSPTDVADADADSDADADADTDADSDTTGHTGVTTTGDTGTGTTGDTGAPPGVLPACPAGQPLDPVMVLDPPTDVEVIGDELVVSLGYNCGCELHVLDACFDTTAFGAGTNPTLDIQVAHDANGDLCSIFCYDEVRLGLLGVQQEYTNTYGEASGAVDLVIEWPSGGGPQTHTVTYSF